MKKECRFCNILKGNGKYGNIDTPMCVKDKFFALASIGALVPGWTLIIPKEHVYNMGKFYGDSSFCDFVDEIANVLKLETNERIVFFEHGANHCDSLTGCGTNHAHLHLIPYDKSIVELASKHKKWIKCNCSDIDSITKGREYLLCGDYQNGFSSSDCYVSIVEIPESQFFRKIIANDLGIPEEYDYKTFVNEINSELTTKYFVAR